MGEPGDARGLATGRGGHRACHDAEFGQRHIGETDFATLAGEQLRQLELFGRAGVAGGAFDGLRIDPCVTEKPIEQRIHQLIISLKLNIWQKENSRAQRSGGVAIISQAQAKTNRALRRTSRPRSE